MEKTIDLRGLVCPEPVLRTKKLLDDKSVDRVEALVESDINVRNLERLARSLKVSITTRQENGHFKVVLSRQAGPGVHEHQAPSPSLSKRPPSSSESEVGTVVFLTKDIFGFGDEEFSRNLLNVFLQTLLESGHRPRAILLANTGVKLMAPESSALKVLNDFKEQGIEVLACGLCVDYYGLKDKVAKEQITNMFAICEFLMSAQRVLSP